MAHTENSDPGMALARAYGPAYLLPVCNCVGSRRRPSDGAAEALELFSVSEEPNPFSRVVAPLLDFDKEAGGRDPGGFGFAQPEGPVMDFQPAIESHHSAVPFPGGLQHAIPSLP